MRNAAVVNHTKTWELPAAVLPTHGLLLPHNMARFGPSLFPGSPLPWVVR